MKLQNESLLHAATKIKNRYIKYFKENMKVKLAVQTFSNSVSDTLVFCNKYLKLDTFKGSESTIEFCHRMNNIFDLLNTRNLLSKVHTAKQSH